MISIALGDRKYSRYVSSSIPVSQRLNRRSYYRTTAPRTYVHGVSELAVPLEHNAPYASRAQELLALEKLSLTSRFGVEPQAPGNRTTEGSI